MKKFLVIILRKNIDIILVGIFWGHTEEMQSMNKRFLVNFYCRSFLFEREVIESEQKTIVMCNGIFNDVFYYAMCCLCGGGFCGRTGGKP